jgi:drug/metabolite transporter (DMT)-like permease
VTPTATSRAAAGRATLSVALSACAFAAIAIFVTVATGAGASLLSVLGWRYIIATCALAAIASFSGIRLRDPSALRVALLSGFGQSIIAVMTLSALRYIPAATLSFLFYTYPAWVAIIARVRHSEPLTPTRMLALALSLAGIFMMVGRPGEASLHPLGVTLALFGAVLYAAYIPMIAALQRNLTPLATSTYMSAGAGVILVGAALLTGQMSADLHSTAWLAILGLSVVSTVAAFLLFLSGLRTLGPVRTAIISTIEPFFTALLGAWLLDQPLTRTTLIGGTLIASAVILLQLRVSENARPTTSLADSTQR